MASSAASDFHLLVEYNGQSGVVHGIARAADWLAPHQLPSLSPASTPRTFVACDNEAPIEPVGQHLPRAALSCSTSTMLTLANFKSQSRWKAASPAW